MTLIPNLVFHHHTSLGDHYICNGIAHNYAKDCETLHIPCSEGNYETVNSLYSDFDNIVVHPMTFQSPVSKHEVDALAAKEGNPAGPDRRTKQCVSSTTEGRSKAPAAAPSTVQTAHLGTHCQNRWCQKGFTLGDGERPGVLERRT